MTTIIRFDRPVNVNKTEMLDYYLNIYGPDNQFIEGYRYKGYSGNAFMDEIKSLYHRYPKSEGYHIEH